MPKAYTPLQAASKPVVSMCNSTLYELSMQMGLADNSVCNHSVACVQADMEEGRHVFQEGNAFTLEALQHQVSFLFVSGTSHLMHQFGVDMALRDSCPCIAIAGSVFLLQA